MATLLASDTRYDWEAYQFVEESLQRTQDRLGRMVVPGTAPSEEQHISARELCDGLWDLAAERYGPLAGQVLVQMGIRTSEDVGEIVWNLVQSDLLMKSERDSKADFHDVIDFRSAFRNLDLTLPENFEEEDYGPTLVFDA